MQNKLYQLLKPDAVERNLENNIKEMFKNNGFYFKGKNSN